VRLSSGPEHSLLTNRPAIVTQSVLPSSQPLPLRQQGSPYSRALRRADATNVRYFAALAARPQQLKVRCLLGSTSVERNIPADRAANCRQQQDRDGSNTNTWGVHQGAESN